MAFCRLFVDGAARGNPGPAGAGGVLFDEAGERIGEVCEYLGTATNNVAEYRALVFGLQEALRLERDEIDVCSDSELVVRQITGQYRIKNKPLIELAVEVQALRKKFRKFTIRHVPREENRDADRMANMAIDVRAAKG